MVYKGAMFKISYLRWPLLIALMSAICWIFLAPSPLPFGMAVQRELGFVGHILAFTVATLACVSAFPKATRWLAMILLGSAICLETAQLIIPGRGADIMDFTMNCFGIVIGITIFRMGQIWATNSSRIVSKT